MAWHLLAEEGPLKGLIIDFSEGEEWVIGRDPDQSDFLLEDSTVSRKHLLCKKTDEGILVKNLSRVNPCTVNDEDFKGFYLLKEGDLLKIGQNTFVFSDEEIGEAEEKKEKKITDTAFDAIFEEEEPTNITEIPEEEPPPSEEPVEEEPVEEESGEEEEIAAEDLPPQEEEKKEEEEKTAYDTIFEDVENIEELPFNLLGEAPLILKVISGPNAGAEIGLQKNHSYVIGKDTESSDIVFQDLSVSRNHAKLSIDAQGKAEIEDLGSKNGTLINGIPIQEKRPVTPQDLVALGTTTFLIIDREAETETIYSPGPSRYEQVKREETREEIKEEELAKIPWKKQVIPYPYLMAAGAVALIVFIAFVSFFSLFKPETTHVAVKDQTGEIKDVLKRFPGVEFSYTPSSGKLFLVGHVLTPIDAEELRFSLSSLPFIDSIENNVIVDQNVWRMANDVLTENGGFRGISIYSPEAGKFVVTGFLPSLDQYERLTEFLSVNFPFLDRLQNDVVVETNLNTQILSLLQAQGFSAVQAQLAGGQVVLVGRYNEKREKEFDALVHEIRGLRGVSSLKNFAIPSSAESSLMDITQNYQVTGFSLEGHKNFSVIVNGRILTVGNNLDGMRVSKILPSMIVLEKDGLKYKIDYSR